MSDSPKVDTPYINTAVVIHGSDSQILLANSMAQQILGLSEDQLRGKMAIDPVWQFFHEDGTPFSLDEYPVNQVLNHQQPINNVIIRIQRPKHLGDIWVQVDAEPVFDQNKKISEVIVTFVDLNEQKRIQSINQTHLHFLKSLNRVNTAIVGTNDLKQMLSNVLKEILSIFDCDRASLVYPCDPDAESWYVPMEHTTPDYPGLMFVGMSMPMTPEVAKMHRVSLETKRPVAFGIGTDFPVPEDNQAFGDKTGIGMALFLKTDKAWGLSITQCSYVRNWTKDEEHLFEEIGRRLTDGLSMLQTQQSLRENEQHLLEAQRIGKIGNWWHDMVTGEIFWSEEFFNILGIEPQKPTIELGLSLIHPDDRALLSDDMKRSTNTAKEFEQEFRIIRPDGEIRWIHNRWIRIEDENGKEIKRVGTHQDITERKQSEHQLSLLNFALNQMHEEAILINEDGQIIYANNQACHGLKYSNEQLTSMNIWEIAPEILQEEWGERWRDIQKKRTLLFDGEHITSDGKRYPVEVSVSYFEFQQQRYLLGLSHNIEERKLAEQEIMRINRFLRVLSSCNESMVHAKDEHSLYQSMCQIVIEEGEFPLAWVGILGEDQTIHIEAEYGQIPKEHIDNRTNIQITSKSHACRPAIKAINSGQIQVIQNLKDANCKSWQQWMKDHNYRSAISLPLLLEDEVFGVLSIYSSDAQNFGKEVTELLSEMAGNISYGVYTLRAKIERESFLNQLQKSMEATIQALANTVDLRDPYTAGHQRRVAALAEVIAREVGLDEIQIQMVSLAGQVHDIGKIAIPAEILSKPGRLSDVEMPLVRTHANAGYEILKNVDFPWPIARIVKQHHERMDGSGYPDGVSGDDILLEARILAVADVVEAMVSHRPYRPGLGIDMALEEIQNGRGTKYDAQVADACTKIFREKGFDFE